MRERLGIPALLLLILTACRTATPVSTPSAATVPIAAMKTLMQRPDIARAMEAVEHDRDGIVAQWRAITEIPAPSGQEAKRAAAIEELLRTYGLENVHRDAV